MGRATVKDGHPVWAVAAADDAPSQSRRASPNIARAKAAGIEAERVEVPGDHFTLIDPTSAAFPALR